MFKRSLTLLAPRIAVAMSGGIDSAVTATLLKEQGFDCVGVFMRNWDNADEDGESRCSISKDFEDMKLICKQLNIEAVEVCNECVLSILSFKQLSSPAFFFTFSFLLFSILFVLLLGGIH